MDPLYDLHTHSSASDGTLTPRALVESAARAGIQILALTDHDTTAGLDEASERAAELGLELIPGIELSVSERGGALEIHILGFGIDAQAPILREHIGRIHAARKRRAAKMVERLNGLGVALGLDRVEGLAAGASLGRPHVARALVQLGACRSEEDAFARYLRAGRPAHVAREERSAREAIEVIHAAGGIACWAHPPLSVGISAPGGIEGFVGRFVAHGLDALEVWHPAYKASTRRRLRRAAREHALLETAGSDFHGAGQPRIRLGQGCREFGLDREGLLALRDRMARRRAMV